MIARIPMNAADEDVLKISEANPGWTVEREADGSVTLSPPGGSENGARELVLSVLIYAWNQASGRGKVFGPSAGFTMPDRAIPSPDAAWILIERWTALSERERRGFAPIVPDVCVELVSPSGSVPELRRKLMRYRIYGASYVLLIDPDRRTVFSDGIPPEGFPIDFSAVFDA